MLEIQRELHMSHSPSAPCPIAFKQEKKIQNTLPKSLHGFVTVSTYITNTETRSRNPSCHGKAINMTCSECVSVALVIHHAVRMRHIVICGLSDSRIFSTLSHKRLDLIRRITEHKMCVLILCTTFVGNVSHSKKNLARYCHKCTYIGLRVKYPLFL